MSHELLPTPLEGAERAEPTESAAFPYLAVPLNLDNPSYASLYIRESLARIEERVNGAMLDARLTGWVDSRNLEVRLRSIIQRSLETSHMERISRNRKANISQFVDVEDERIQHAFAGAASPLELLSSLEDYPKIETIELAKLSHPLDNSAAEAMTSEVERALCLLDATILPGEPRYKRKLYDEEISAAVVLRKQAISEYDVEAGRIQVVSRRAFLVRGDEAAKQFDPLLDRKVRNLARIDELGKKIERYLPNLSEYHRDLKWLQPIATSYYAKYLPPKDKE